MAIKVKKDGTEQSGLVDDDVIQSFSLEKSNVRGRMVRLGSTLVSGDCIDEMLGGYYGHLENSDVAFERFMSNLVPHHLEGLARYSDGAGVTVWLPFAEPDVVEACRAFPLQERLRDGERKVPMLRLARRLGVPKEIVRRRKIGLVAVRGVHETGSRALGEMGGSS